MLNKLKHFKSPLIVILIMSAILQTGQLWFVNITNRNFFFSLYESIVNPVVPDGHSQFVTPWRIITGHGDNRFSIQYSGLPDSEAKQYCDRVLTAVIKSGEYVNASAVDYKTLLGVPVYLYDYAFTMPSDIFARNFNPRSNQLNTRGPDSFERIILQPPNVDDDNVHVYFIDNETAYEFRLSKNNRQEPSEKFTHDIPEQAYNETSYYSAALSNETGTAPDTFIALWPDGGKSYRSVRITNPYANLYGEKLLYSIQDRVEVFFDNPATLSAGISVDGVYTFSNANTVVRYYDRDILEYTSYKVIDKSVPSSLMSDYSAALTFINKDAYIVNEIYMAGYSITDEGQTIFYFDYVINDLPLIMPDKWPSASENGHPIEIAVDYGTVVKYKKLVYNFHIDENTTLTGRKTFSDIMGSFYLLADEKRVITVSHVLLAYRIEPRDALTLYWVVEADGDKLFKSVGI